MEHDRLVPRRGDKKVTLSPREIQVVDRVRRAVELYARNRGRGWTLALAAQMGVTHATVVRWREGQNVPDVISLCRLAEALNTTTDYLVGRSEDATAPAVLDEPAAAALAGYIEREGVIEPGERAVIERQMASYRAGCRVPTVAAVYGLRSAYRDTRPTPAAQERQQEAERFGEPKRRGR